MSEENAENNPQKRKWRRKKKNFLSNAKKYAKKGQMGRGTKMSEELYQYFVGILDVMKAGIENEDERHALVNNVLERTKGEELEVIGNQLGCRVIELLLPFSSPEDLERYMEALTPDLRKLSADNFTSHVIEALLRVACQRATEHLQDETSESEDIPKKKRKKTEKKDKKYSEEHVQKCHEFTLKLCKYMLNNLEEFVWDQYANHILRSALKCLSGITLLPGEKPKVNLFKESVADTKKGIPPHTTKIDYKPVPDEFKDIVKEFGQRLSAWPQFKDLPYQPITSGLLQVLLYAMKNIDKNLTRDLIRKLLDESFAPEGWVSTGGDEKKDKIDVDAEDEKQEKPAGDGDDGTEVAQGCTLPPVFESQPAVRLLEAALFVAKKKMYTQLYARCFINRIARLACVPMLNFTIQRLIDNCNVKEEFEPMYEELSDKLGDLLASGNSGVLVALCKACLRLNAKQAQFVTSLEAALKCSEPENQKYFSVCVLRLSALRALDPAAPRAPGPAALPALDPAALHQDYFIHVHGSVILQTLLDFQRPAKAVSGLLELSPEQLLVVLCDSKGCHVADALCAGRCVGVKARDKLVWKLKGYYQKLALSQYGSRAFEQIFNVASLEQKVKIMAELADKSSLLNSTQYGRIIADKMELDKFKSSQKQWEQKWSKKVEKINGEKEGKIKVNGKEDDDE